jgi:hypothetical protein
LVEKLTGAERKMEKTTKDFFVMKIQGEYNFTREQGEILKALLDSKDKGTMIALAVPSIGSGVFITAAVDVSLNDGETFIHLKSYDVTGRIIEKTCIPLKEIEGACILHSQWENPFLKNLANDRLQSQE